jgi:hypothetical protein
MLNFNMAKVQSMSGMLMVISHCNFMWTISVVTRYMYSANKGTFYFGNLQVHYISSDYQNMFNRDCYALFNSATVRAEWLFVIVLIGWKSMTRIA